MEDFIKFIISAGLASIIGFERKIFRKPAGIRTHVLVALGACLMSILSKKYYPFYPHIIGYTLASIGFLGAGTIIREGEKVIGLTTAASLWLTCAVGLAVGLGEYLLALTTVLISLLTLEEPFFWEWLSKLFSRRKSSNKQNSQTYKK